MTARLAVRQVRDVLFTIQTGRGRQALLVAKAEHRASQHVQYGCRSAEADIFMALHNLFSKEHISAQWDFFPLSHTHCQCFCFQTPAVSKTATVRLGNNLNIKHFLPLHWGIHCNFDVKKNDFKLTIGMKTLQYRLLQAWSLVTLSN